MSGEKRECACKQARHQHGTYLAYNADLCRCSECLAAKNARQNELRRRRAQLRWQGQTVLVSAVGSRRRLQALTANGWSLRALGIELGVSARAVTFLRDDFYRSVRPDTAARVVEVYERLWSIRPEGNGPNLARRYAQERGWVPPLAWDDDEIDDPAATPHTPTGGPRELAPCGTAAAVRRHYRNGEPLDVACFNASCRDAVEKRARRAA